VAADKWLLLIHQIPPKPGYLRVKIWRRLQRIGAVAIKNSVWALPRSDTSQEDLQWTMREVVAGGGDASLVEARFVEGLTDDAIESMFRAARDADYGAIAADARRAKEEPDVARLERRLAEVAAIDFFAAGGRGAAESAVHARRVRLSPRTPTAAAPRTELRGRTWVTRRGIHVDRIASAWLVRRFVDPDARFAFVASRGHVAAEGEIRFDMFEAEFTHEGDDCTFEVLVRRCGLVDPALRPIAEIVHDVDLKDEKFERPEAPGIDRLIAGIAIAHADDEARLARGTALFDDLYEYYKRKPA
jgi:hypothetical protein